MFIHESFLIRLLFLLHKTIKLFLVNPSVFETDFHQFSFKSDNNIDYLKIMIIT